ncbi:PaaI family thioesterase [Piscinibacter koreensis]|uniref:PaaI family thioesterase n=1 Tax=Piscinibacter koreensis TaxID=2742824 RepID=A0A7Y6NLN7_9BURK|nr:PaaI family thioesterase [Schlegelella koreensis]NUZ05362.1 PaaI family thioesterase [Schlegelella koreensis]
MQSPSIPFRLSAEQRDAKLARFNARHEVVWFGFRGSFDAPGTAVIGFTRLDAGLQGGGGTSAINGGVIAAGFDAAFVLAGLAQYEAEVVVTLELSVKFLSLARANESLAFRAHVVRSARSFAFAEGFLSNGIDAGAPHLAIATAMVAPAR